mmetsp:Transcript_6284/g.9133  ORF Transcript_6284/g.9133 Transcript_6284/m.9133 type:complete len:106 (+) Transcript_6284:34-351(+)
MLSFVYRGFNAIWWKVTLVGVFVAGQTWGALKQSNLYTSAQAMEEKEKQLYNIYKEEAAKVQKYFKVKAEGGDTSLVFIPDGAVTAIQTIRAGRAKNAAKESESF